MRASPDTVLSPLPRCFVRAVFLLLPADQRLRCVEVSRAWRALLADTTLWSCLNVSRRSGCTRFSEALFHAAVAKAGGQLRELNVNRRNTLSTRTLVEALVSNAASLQVLNALFPAPNTPAEVVGYLEAAPLSVCTLCVQANAEQARRCARNEPPYERLRVHSLLVDGKEQLDSLESLQALCTDLVKHPSLKQIFIQHASVGTAAAMRVFVNTAIALRVEGIGLVNCGCTRACVPELTRLVSAGAVQRIYICNREDGLFEAGDDTNQFCAAIRASALKRLKLTRCGPNLDVATVAAFINARQQ